jgi:dolichyl-phosphate beta-glucosyltransferase
MSINGPVLSIVLPFRNQADHAARVLALYRTTLDTMGRVYELVVVPNGCTDNTLAVVTAFARDCPVVRVVESPQGGWGLAVRLGLNAAQGAVLCYTNTARTDPRHIGELFALYEQHAPCLAKVRRYRRSALLREVGSWLYNLEARLLFGVHAADVNGTPKMFSRELIPDLDLQSDGDLLDLELIAKAHRIGLPVIDLPLEGFRRHGGRSSTNWRSAWRMYWGAWRLRRSLAVRGAHRVGMLSRPGGTPGKCQGLVGPRKHGTGFSTTGAYAKRVDIQSGVAPPHSTGGA